MKLQLPDVTLVMVETREHTLARMAIEDCLRVAEFGEVLIITDKPGEFAPTINAQFKIVEDWPTKLGWSQSWWFDVPPLLRTKHTLNIQWDSWIWKPEHWGDDFLKYDYIGAPWLWHKDAMRVGNGGFSLVSSRLKRYVADRRLEYPCDTALDDDLLCRKYRPRLEAAGFLWAPEKVAHRFAFECNPPLPGCSFGFHAMFNWPVVLDRKRLRDRMQIALASPYIAKPGSYILKAFCEKNPDVIKEFLAVNESQGLDGLTMKEPNNV